MRHTTAALALALAACTTPAPPEAATPPATLATGHLPAVPLTTQPEPQPESDLTPLVAERPPEVSDTPTEVKPDPYWAFVALSPPETPFYDRQQALNLAVATCGDVHEPGSVGEALRVAYDDWIECYNE